VFEVANHQLRLDAERYLLSISQISTPVLPNSDSTQKWPNHRKWVHRYFISTDQPISEIAKAPIAVLTCHKSESANLPHQPSTGHSSHVPSRQSCGATPLFSRPFDFNSITAPNQTHPSHPKPPSIPIPSSNPQKREADLRPPLKVKFQDS
jgi:hypothetical protein